MKGWSEQGMGKCLSKTSGDRLVRGIWLRRALQVLAVFVVIVSLHYYQTRSLVSGPAPAFNAQLLDSTPVSLDQYLGSPLLLQFWATWCPVCRLEQGSIQSISADHAVLSVALDSMSDADLENWMQKEGLDYPAIRDADGELSALYGVQGVPTSLVIDANGKIRFVDVGYTTEWGLRARLWWVGL